ncbi:MBL fold metallo-hydrolase [Brevibacillus fulvus]|uniref:Glyoxylase-like metal-dependent hydrolase (Beta-lactamase superfamily II) n=1 Tax=Brevibacillus fulvus TaxID=1125967 RepID=A0A939BN64_9BACL|nr:glyoxylase-like metal-dependent hydrolase (beta-lactamase superfamily II) [Brevibacillus fulvus]
MSNLTKQLASNVWAIIIYEPAWKSFINSYVIAKKDTFVLIDSHLRKHRPYFQQALQQIGVKENSEVTAFFTHRHADHIGNAELFSSRNNWIHLDDYYELDDFSQTLFGHTFMGNSGDLQTLQFKQLPFHTEGSVAFYDKESKICFIGDHLCFFSAPIGNVVGFEAEHRQSYLEFIGRWKEREPERIEAFVQGLRAVMEWPMEMLATGHGPVLQGEIKPFLQSIITTLTADA